MRKKVGSKNTQTFNLKDYFIIAFGIGFPLYFILLMINGAVRDCVLDNYSDITEATIINSKNYWSKGAISNTFSYDYQFEVNGKIYERDSREIDLRVGQKVEVEYLPVLPVYNRLKEK